LASSEGSDLLRLRVQLPNIKPLKRKRGIQDNLFVCSPYSPFNAERQVVKLWSSTFKSYSTRESNQCVPIAR